MTSTEREELRKLRGGDRRLRVEREILARQRPGSPGRRDRRGLPVHEAPQTEFHVVMMARVLGVCSSGFYASLRRRRSAQSLLDDDLLRQVRDIHRRGRGTYGAPRSRAELVESALRRGRKRVAHLMRDAGVAGVRRRKGPRTTRRDPQALGALDLVNLPFTADAPDRQWLAGITYVPTGHGSLYLATATDAFSGRNVGWSTASHLRKELPR